MWGFLQRSRNFPELLSMPEIWDFWFGGKRESNTPSWENIGNTEGLPVVESEGHNGYHRAFFMLGNAKREWLLVRRTERGFEPVDDARYQGIGRVEPLTNGGVRARVFHARTQGGGEEEWITLPPLTT